MPKGNAEIVIEIVDAFNRRDLDAYVSRMSPDVEWDVTEGFLGIQDVYRGHEGVGKWWHDFLEAWDSFQNEIVEVSEGADGAVLLTMNGKGRGDASGVELDLIFCFVLWLSESKVTRLRMFRDRELALEAAGLSA